MSKMRDDSFFHALKYTFSSGTSQDAEKIRAIDENTLDTEFRTFLLRAGLPEAELKQSKLKPEVGKIVYNAQVDFIGGMTSNDAKAIVEKMTDAGVDFVDDGTTFEGDDRSPFGYLKIEIEAKNAVELQNKLQALQEKRETMIKLAPSVLMPALTAA